MKTFTSIIAIAATLASQSLAANDYEYTAYCKSEGNGPWGYTTMYQSSSIDGWNQVSSNWIDLDLYNGADEKGYTDRF